MVFGFDFPLNQSIDICVSIYVIAIAVDPTLSRKIWDDVPIMTWDLHQVLCVLGRSKYI